MAIVDGNPVNASYTNSKVMSKQNDNSILGSITTAKYYSTQKTDVATAATINNLSTASGFIRLTGSTPTTVNGLADGTDGKEVIVYNESSALVTFANQSLSATSSDRILSPTAADILVYTDYSVLLKYDSGQSRWIVISYPVDDAASLTANRAVVTDASKNFAASATTSTEIGYVSGVTSAIQAQIDGKQATGNYITALTGDVTASGPGSVASTLATVNSNVGSFGTATQVGSVTVNAKGLVTAASNTSIAIPSTQVTDFTEASQDAVGAMVGSSLVYVDGTPLLARAALTGDITASQDSNATTLATVNSNVGTYGDSTNVAQVTVNAKGLITAVSNVSISASGGGGYTVASSQTTGFTASISNFYPCDGSSAGFTATLPTAVSNSGKQIKIIKTDATSNAITINTTSSQTIGDRSSGDITLTRINDYLEVISDGSNWLIMDKKQYGFLSNGNAVALTSIGDTNYGTLATNVSLTKGMWKLSGQFSLNQGSGASSSPAIAAESGFYGADGANSSSVPTALGGVISGSVNWTTLESAFAIFPGNTGNNTRFPTARNEIIVQVSTTTSAYLVPRIFNPAGSAAVWTYITAERLW